MKKFVFTKTLKEKWIKALRSGRYKQGKGALCKTDEIDGKSTYCCLGVLQKVARAKTGSVGFLKATDFGEDFIFLPRNVQRELAGKNDNGESFAQIAEFIEKAL